MSIRSSELDDERLGERYARRSAEEDDPFNPNGDANAARNSDEDSLFPSKNEDRRNVDNNNVNEESEGNAGFPQGREEIPQAIDTTIPIMAMPQELERELGSKGTTAWHCRGHQGTARLHQLHQHLALRRITPHLIRYLQHDKMRDPQAKLTTVESLRAKAVWHCHRPWHIGGNLSL
jgi:hypothetical protein